MPLKSKFGYIFNVEKNEATITARTIAHELGHGFFELRHTFVKKYNVKQGTTDNLMDYNNGRQLIKYQWDVLHDPKKRLFDWAQGEGEGQHYIPHSDYTLNRSAVENLLKKIRKSTMQKKGAALTINEDYMVIYADTVMICKQNVGPIYIGIIQPRNGMKIINDKYFKMSCHISGKNEKYNRLTYMKDGDYDEHRKLEIDYPEKSESIILNYLAGNKCNNLINKDWDNDINKTIMLVNSITVSNDINKNKNNKTLSYFSDNWDTWNAQWKNTDDYKWISKLKIDDTGLPNWLKDKRHITAKGEFNGIPDTIIQIIRPGLLRQGGLQVWGCKYGKTKASIQYYKITELEPTHIKTDNIDKTASYLILAPYLLTKQLSKFTKSVWHIGGSFQGKVGVEGATGQVNLSIGIANDPDGNYAVFGSLGAVLSYMYWGIAYSGSADISSMQNTYLGISYAASGNIGWDNFIHVYYLCELRVENK